MVRSLLLAVLQSVHCKPLTSVNAHDGVFKRVQEFMNFYFTKKSFCHRCSHSNLKNPLLAILISLAKPYIPIPRDILPKKSITGFLCMVALKINC